MTKYVDDPQKETGVPSYPQEFNDLVLNEAKNLGQKGFSQDQIQSYMNERYNRYKADHVGSDVQYEDKPDWAESDRIEMKNTTKKRGFINRIGRALTTIQAIPTGVGMRFFNPLKGEEQIDKDVINSDMINSTDTHVKSLLTNNGDRDASQDIKSHIESTRESLATEFNPSGERTQRFNNEVLMEESYSEIISKELEDRLSNIETEIGKTKRDFILSDPKKIKEMKKMYVDMGYTGRMVDRAFEKVLFEDKRDHFADYYDESIIKNNESKDIVANEEAINANLYSSTMDRATKSFNPDELNRMQLNMQLEELRELKATGDDIKGIEDQIAVLDEKLGYNTQEKAAKSGVSYGGAVYIPGSSPVQQPVKIGTEDWERDVFYRMYDKDGKKIMRGDESKEEVEQQQQVTEHVKLLDPIKDDSEKLMNEMIKSEKILLGLEQAETDLEAQFSQYQGAKTLAIYGTGKQRQKLDDKDLDQFERANEYKRRRDLILEEQRQERNRHEAVSRMYFLNQNIAMEDKNLRTLAGLGAVTIRDINMMPFLKNPKPSIEEAKAVVDPIYQDLGIELDSEEYKKTSKNFINEVVVSGAHLTDIAIKMMILDKTGFAGITKFVDRLGEAGKVYKAAGNIVKMGLEEGKFRMVGGEAGTGAAFYVANKAIPNVRFKKPWMDVIVNGFMKGSAGITGAMEGASQIEAAWHAATNDNDVIREMTEAFGPLDEAKRRIAVNFLAAAPFGVKGMYERGKLPHMSPKALSELADVAEKNGKGEAAADLRSVAATLGDSKLHEQYSDTMYKIDMLKEHNTAEKVRYDKSSSIEDINKEYDNLIQELEIKDPLKNKKVTSNVDDNYFNAKVQFDSREYAGKIETLQKNGIKVDHQTPISEVEAKYEEILKAGNAYMNNIREGVEPVTESGEIVTPNRRQAYKPFESETSVKKAYGSIDATPAGENFNKNIKAPAKSVVKTLLDLKKKVDKQFGVKETDVKVGEKAETPKPVQRILKTGEGATTREMTRKGEKAGEITVEESTDGWRVKRVDVEPAHQRKGVATETYRELNRQANREGTVLKSDVAGKVNAESKALWEKLVKNGEAKRNEDGTYEMKKEVSKGTSFDELIDTRSGLKGGVAELEAMVTRLFDVKSKKEALDIVSKIEDIVHMVEVSTAPESSSLNYATRTPNQSESSVSKYRDFRNNISAYKRGQAEGRRDLAERANEIYDFIRLRISPKNVAKVLTATEVKALAKPLPKNATQKHVLERLERMETLFQKLETRQFKADTQKKLRSLAPKLKGQDGVVEKVGVVGASKMLTSDVLYNNNIEGAKSLMGKLVTLRRGTKDGSFEQGLIDAQMNALSYTGSRELALERQAELESMHKTKELSISEKMEYEMLNMVDNTKMNHIDALRAKETVFEMERTGRTVQERASQAKKVINGINTTEALKAINADQLKIEEMDQVNPKKKGAGRRIVERIKEASKYVGSSQESFITMMEMLSETDPNREGAWEGYFHTFSKDFHRSREAEMGEKNRKLNQMREDLQVIHGAKGRKFDRMMKRNSKDVKPFKYSIAGRVEQIKNGITVDQATRWWQLLHNKATWPLWAKLGFGVKGEKFDVEQVNEFKRALEDFVEVNTGNNSAIKAAKYQMEKYSELYRDVNEVYSKQNGVDLGYTVNYVPVVFEKGVKMLGADGKEVDIGNYTDMLNMSAEQRVASSAPVFTKATQQSGNLKLDLKQGSEQVFSDYLNSAMHYKYFQEPIRRADGVFGKESVKKALKAKYGTKAGDYVSQRIEKSLKDIAADAAEGKKMPWLTKMKNNFVAANLGANVILLPKQMMSVDAYRTGAKTAAEEALFTRYLMDGLASAKGWEAIKELNNSEMMVNRAAGHSYNKDLLEQQKTAARLYKTGKLRPGNVREALLFATKLGDRGAILLGGQALYRMKTDMYVKKGSSLENAKKRAYEDFVTFTKLTQQSGNIEDLGHIQRAGTLGKYATIFQNTPQQYYRIEMQAVRNGIANANKLKKGGLTPEQKQNAKNGVKRAARDFFVYHFLLPMTFRAASQGFYLGGDDKGRDRFIDDEGHIVTALLGSLSYGFMFGDLLTNIMSKVVTGHGFETEIGGVLQDVITGTEEAVLTAIEIAGAEDFQLEWNRIMDGTAPITWADVLNVGGTVAEYAGGLPVRSPALMVKGIAEYRNYKTDDIRAWAGYSSGVLGHYDRSPQYGTMAPYFGAEENIDKFLAYMRKTTDPDYYKGSEKRWQREFRIYNHFGGYNDDVNFLYTLARTNKDRAKYLRAIRDGKTVLGMPTSIADLKQALGPPMGQAEYFNLQQELLEYGVISPEVLIEIENQDKQFKKKMIAPFRKTGK